MKKKLIFLLLGGLLALVPLAQGDMHHASANTPLVAPKIDANQLIKVSKAKIRLMPPVATSTALYLTLRNTGKTPVKLISAEVYDTNDHQPLAKEVMLHKTISEGNMKKMVHLDSIDIGPGKRVRLKPGGVHIMLINLNHPIKKEDIYQVKLSFADKSSLVTTATVKRFQPRKPRK